MADTTHHVALPSPAMRQQSTTVQDLRDNRLADSSKNGYRSGMKQIVKWLQTSGRSDRLNADGSLNLTVFSYMDFTEFVLYKYKDAGVSLSTLSGYRSALKDYYNTQGVPLPIGFTNDATIIYQGIRRLCASETQAGDIKPGTKQPLRYHEYIELCMASLVDGNGWIDHFSDEGYALGVTFFKSKTDQGGTKRRDPKHVYAYPQQPGTCCILALVIYLACNPEHDSGDLFPGSAQRDRFGRSLSELVGYALPEVASAVGTHSLRKGAATFAIGGSTSGPSIVNVCIRCGWSIGSVVERYVFLEDTLPAKHPLLSSVLFGDVGMTTLLRANVTLLSSSMQPTGIPPHVSLHTQLEKNLAAVRALPGEIRDGIESLLDEKGVSAGNITHALLEQLLKNAVASVVDARPIIVSTRSPAQDESVPVRPVHYWGGRWHLLAEDYELPSVDVSTGWHLWWCGSPARDIPPLYKI
ncbi:hypothetical protein DYB26_015732, partial [Aphanomyces astaci]